jgi:hypothetical protein
MPEAIGRQPEYRLHPDFTRTPEYIQNTFWLRSASRRLPEGLLNFLEIEQSVV